MIWEEVPAACKIVILEWPVASNRDVGVVGGST